MTVPKAVPGTYRHHGNRVVGIRTTDSVDPLSALTREQLAKETAPQVCKHSLTTEGVCGCKACQQRRRTQVSKIRTVADINQANRRAFGLQLT